MQSMTQREYLTRLAWLEDNWSIPNRSDHYLMQIAQEVRRVLSKSPNKIQLRDFEIKFISKEHSETTQQKDNKLSMSKASWFGALGIPK